MRLFLLIYFLCASICSYFAYQVSVVPPIQKIQVSIAKDAFEAPRKVKPIPPQRRKELHADFDFGNILSSIRTCKEQEEEGNRILFSLCSEKNYRHLVEQKTFCSTIPAVYGSEKRCYEKGVFSYLFDAIFSGDLSEESCEWVRVLESPIKTKTCTVRHVEFDLAQQYQMDLRWYFDDGWQLAHTNSKIIEPTWTRQDNIYECNTYNGDYCDEESYSPEQEANDYIDPNSIKPDLSKEEIADLLNLNSFLEAFTEKSKSQLFHTYTILYLESLTTIRCTNGIKEKVRGYFGFHNPQKVLCSMESKKGMAAKEFHTGTMYFCPAKSDTCSLLHAIGNTKRDNALLSMGVSVQNILYARGVLQLALYDQESWEKQTPLQEYSLPIENKETLQHVFTNLQRKSYIVKAHHDVVDDESIQRRTFVTDGYGVSGHQSVEQSYTASKATLLDHDAKNQTTIYLTYEKMSTP